MTKVRKRHNAEFKSKVAIEAIKEHPAAKSKNYGISQSQASIAAQLAAIVNKHFEPPKEKLLSPEEMAVATEAGKKLAALKAEREANGPAKAPPRPRGAGPLWGTGISGTPPAEAVSAVRKR